MRMLRLAAVAAAAVLVLSACNRAEGVAKPPLPTVTVAHAVAGDAISWDRFTGRFEAVNHVELRPRVSGYIDRVSVAEGQLVRKDDLLFQIDPRTYRAELDRASAEVARSRSQRELAASQLARAERLLAAHAVSHEEYEQRQSENHQAEANLNAALAAERTARLNLDFTRVTAPISGRVSRADVTAGNYVTAGQTELTSIVSVDPIYVYFDADERSYLRYAKLRAGAKGSAAVGLADEEGYPHEGQLDFFDNAMNPQAGTMRARIVLDNHDGRFSPGLFARIRLATDGAHPAVLIDDRAVNTDQNRRFVFIVDSSKHVAYREIEPGEIADNGMRIVRSGLAVGETVIVAGALGVGPGAAVDTKEDDHPSLASTASGAAP
jgi:RND family efflux transporter MFP subunit